MIPDVLDHPGVQAHIIDRLASGDTGRAIAKDLGVSQSCVSAFRAREEEAIRERCALLRRVAFEEAERAQSFAKATRARLEDAQAAPGASRSAPQSYRAVSEVLELVGGPRDITINGDVDASVNVSADVRVIVAQSTSAAELRARAEELRAKLGF